MIEKLLPKIHHATETLPRSIVKTVSYRVVILILDFISIYLFTGQIKVKSIFFTTLQGDISFPTSAEDINTYLTTARQSIKGFMAIGTFSDKRTKEMQYA